MKSIFCFESFNNISRPRKSMTKIAPPSGVDELLQQLQSNTDDTISDNISISSNNSYSRKNRSRRAKNISINIGNN